MTQDLMERVVQNQAVPPEHPVLSDLTYRKLGWKRWLHGMPELSLKSLPRMLLRMQFWRGRIFRLLWRRAAEISWAWLHDAKISLFGQKKSILFSEQGDLRDPAGRSVALYIHYSPTGIISEMVQRQLEAYNSLGFGVVFISNAPVRHSSSWRAARQRAALLVHRRNFGHDFGAWKDLLPLVLRCWPAADEILLVNDSCLGPVRPLDGTLAAMRAGGDGVFGMQESLQGGTHLQSWFILARGTSAITDIAGFLSRMRLSVSKWKTIQRGELSLSREMLKRGHRVRAVHSYSGLVAAALADPVQCADLMTMLLDGTALESETAKREALEKLVLSRPLNPTHHLWRVLLQSPYCSFIKTELIHKNPGNVPHVSKAWRSAVPVDAPCPVEVLDTHLACFRRGPDGAGAAEKTVRCQLNG